jgi:hypothetical protein
MAYELAPTLGVVRQEEIITICESRLDGAVDVGLLRAAEIVICQNHRATMCVCATLLLNEPLRIDIIWRLTRLFLFFALQSRRTLV